METRRRNLGLLSETQAADEVDQIIRNYATEEKFKIVPLGRFDGRDIYLGYRAECKP